MDADFPISEYVCRSCSNLIDIHKNTSVKIVKKPVENVVLSIGQKGIINNTEYTVTGIVVRKYGASIFWREYYLKDQSGKDAFLSESDGHWVLLHPIDGMEIKRKPGNSIVIEVGPLNFRRYETTECHIYAAAGFFEDPLDFGLSTYKEYVNGTRMISEERSGGNIQYFSGDHISRYQVKKAFAIDHLPYYTGIGIVQPFYVNAKQAVNIMSVAALLICMIQLYVVATRTNKYVFEQEINFEDVRGKEMVSQSFQLSGGSAPLNVQLYSDVDNSWANVGLGLVNESNNEIIFASKDIEEYHGYEDGENWSEGDKSEDFNFCGVAPGKYHFVVSAEKQETPKSSVPSSYRSADGNLYISRDSYGIISITDNTTAKTESFSNAKLIKSDSMIGIGKLIHETLGKADIDSLLNSGVSSEYADAAYENKSVKIKAEWLPVSFRNFVFVLLFMIAVVIAVIMGKRSFERSKWFNSDNSPYTYS